MSTPCGVESGICSFSCIWCFLSSFHSCRLHSKPVFSQCVGALFTWPQGEGYVCSYVAGTLKGGVPACTMVVWCTSARIAALSVASLDLDFLLVHDPHLLKLLIVVFTMGFHFFFMLGLQNSIGSAQLVGA